MDKRMPILTASRASYTAKGLVCPVSLPWKLFDNEKARKQALSNHSQTIERLAERGGLDPTEAVAILRGRPYPDAAETKDKMQAALDYLKKASYSQEILWRQFPDKPNEGFVLGLERAFEGDSGIFFLRDQDTRPAGTLIADATLLRLAAKIVEVVRKVS